MAVAMACLIHEQQRVGESQRVGPGTAGARFKFLGYRRTCSANPFLGLVRRPNLRSR